MHRLTSAASAACILLLAACQPTRPAAGPPAPPADARLHPSLAGCAAPGAEARPACVEQALLALLRAEGVARAMAVLERAAEVDPEIRRQGHVYAHAIGLAAYDSPRSVGATYARCTPAFQSGCYHGVIQAYFVDRAGSDGAVAPEAVDSLCSDHRGPEGDPWLLFQCAHGMGHGLTMISSYHLPRALRACDLVSSGWEREACYGGAFMENITQSTAPHHTVGRPQMAHGHAGHGAAAGEPPYRGVDPADPLYPCSTLEARYLTACYQMQTSAVLFLNRGDFAATARVCAGAPEAYRATCFQSLGRDLSSYVLQDHEAAIRTCGAVDAAYRPACHVGYVKNLVDLSADAGDGMAYCRLLPEPASKRACYVAVGQQIWVLGRTPERMEALCRASEPEYLEACRAGTGNREQMTGNREQ